MIEYFKAVLGRRRDDEGASGVEYGLLVAAIAAVIVATVFILGQWVLKSFDDTCKNISGTPGGPAATCDNPPVPPGG